MVVEINHDWRIRSDDRNYILEERSVVRDEGRAKVLWYSRGYYKSLSHALKAAGDVILKSEGNHSLDSLQAALAGITARLDAIGNRCVALWGKG